MYLLLTQYSQGTREGLGKGRAFLWKKDLLQASCYNPYVVSNSQNFVFLPYNKTLTSSLILVCEDLCIPVYWSE